MNETLERTQSPKTLTLQIKRVIKAKRERVYDAWTKPELIAKWLAPGELTVVSASADPKVGGSYHVTMDGGCGNSSGSTSTMVGIYTEVIPNERLCFTWGAHGSSDPETLVTVELKDVAGGTELTLRHERFESQEACSQHEYGWNGCLDKLETYVATVEG